MKKIIVMSALSIFALTACKKDPTGTMTVIKDCSGSYLRFDGKDYNVCNYSALDPYANGATVTASYKTLNGCDNGRVVCKIHHTHEGWIEVIKIR